MFRKRISTPPVHLLEYSAPFCDDTAVPQRLQNIFRAAHAVADELSLAPASERSLPTFVSDESQRLPSAITRLLDGYPFGLQTFLGATVVMAVPAVEASDSESSKQVLSVRDGFAMSTRILDIKTFRTSQPLQANDLSAFRTGLPSGHQKGAVRETSKLTVRAVPRPLQEPTREGLSGTCSTLSIASPAKPGEMEWRQDLRMEDLASQLDTIAPWVDELQTSLTALLARVRK